jgi:tetratricopeptide (TPR) repeat protein
MIRHQKYFEVLSTLDENSESWLPTLAGLAVLERVDAIRDDPSVARGDWTGSAAVVETIGRISDGNPLRRSLMRVVQNLRCDKIEWAQVNDSLFGFGRALDMDGSWTLAVDVFATVADIAREDDEPKVAIEATTALGGAARRSGDWDRSAEGYADAAHLASALGDKALGLTVRVGTANTLMARGNLPEAKSVLDEVIAEAESSKLQGVAGLALHSRATVAHLEKQYADAVTLAYRALENTTNATFRDNITSDIAAAFVELGMHDAGRDANLVLSITSRYQWVRSQATLNLMELAAMNGMEEAFEGYANQLKAAPLDPRLRSYFLLYYGQGCEQFGRYAEAERFMDEAREFATSHKIHQVAFEAEQALATAGKKTRQRAVAVESWRETVPPDVRYVAEAFANLREAAMSSCPGGGSL